MPLHTALDVVAAPDWATSGQVFGTVLSWVVTVVSLYIAVAQHRNAGRANERQQREAREAQERQEVLNREAQARQEALTREIAEQQQRFQAELETAKEQRQQAREQERESRARAEDLEREKAARIERATLVAAAWGNEAATRGDVDPPSEYGAVLHNNRPTAVYFPNVTVRYDRPARWISKETFSPLVPSSTTKWAARKIYHQALGDLPPDGMTEQDWARTHAFDVELTFVDAGGFWLANREGVRELPSKLVVWAEATRGAALRRHIQGFRDEYGVDVTVEDFDDLRTLQHAYDSLADNRPDAHGLPDVLVGPHDWLGRVLRQESVEEVRLAGSQRLSFHPKSLEALTDRGNLYAIPYVFDSVALVRNPAVAGDGALPATFDELVAHGQELVKEGRAEHPVSLQVGEHGDPYHLWPLFSSAGGTLFGLRDDGGFDGPEVWRDGFVRAFERIATHGEAGSGTLSRRIGRADAEDLFLYGKTAYLVCASRILTKTDARGLRVDVHPVPPLGDDAARSLVSTYGFFISRYGENTRIAQDLVTHYLARTDTGERLAEIQPRPPVQSDAMRRVSATDARVAVYVEQCEAGQVMPKYPQMREVWAALGRAQAAVVGGADPVATAEAAIEEGRQLLDGAGR